MKTRTSKLLLAFTLVLALVFGFVAVPTSEAITLGTPAEPVFGSETQVKLNVSEALLADAPPEVADLLDNISLNITQMSDSSAELPVNYLKVDVAGKDGVALTVDALTEDGKLLLDVPQLFDTALDVDLAALLNEVMSMAQAQTGSIGGLTKLKDLDLTKLMGTFNGVAQIVSAHTPEATAGAAETYTIETLSAELTAHEIVFESEQINAILDEIVTFLETDEGALELYEVLIKPMAASQGAAEEGEKSWADLLAEFKAEAADELENAKINVTSLKDAQDSVKGFNITFADTNEDGAEDNITFQGLMLDDAENGEAELRVINPNDEMFRLFFHGTDSTEVEGAFNGSFKVALYETPDVAGASQEFVNGTFTNMRSVPFANASMMLGEVKAVINTENENMGTVTLLYNMAETEAGKYNGVVGLENMATLALDIAEIPAETVSIPLGIKDKEAVTIASMNDLQGLLTEDVQMRLMQVLSNLGIPMGGTATPDAATPDTTTVTETVTETTAAP